MPVLTPKTKTVSISALSPVLRVTPVLRAARKPFRVPAWLLAALVLVAAATAFAAGRQKPAHHYVPYFGNMVLDTTTGKACYATAPKPSDPILEDSAFAIGGAAPQHAAGPSIPVCSEN